MANQSVISNTFKHAAIYGLAGIFQKAIGFLMLPVYAHYLRAEGYGIYGMIEVVLAVLTILVGYGIESAMERLYFTKNSSAEKNRLVSTSIFSMFILIVVICLPAFLLRGQIAKYAFGIDGIEYYITLAILTFIADTTAMNAQRYILIKQRSIFFSILSISRLLIGLSLNIYLIVLLNMGVLGVLYSGLITATVFTIVIHGYVLKSVGVGFSKEDAIKIFKFSLPMVPGFFAMFVRNNAAKIIIRSHLGLAELGVLSLISKFSALIFIFVHDPFMKIWTVKRLKICEEESGPETIARMFTLNLSLLLFFGLFISLEIPLLVEVLAPDEFWVNSNIALFAVFSVIPLCCYYHLIFGVLYKKETYKISIIQITAAFISVGANLLLIRLYGILGAFMAEAVVNLGMCTQAYFYSKKHYAIPFEGKKILLLIFVAFILFFAINPISISKLGLNDFFNNNLRPFVNLVADVVHLDKVKDGKLVLLLNEKFPAVFDGFVKAIFSLTFLVSLLIIKIIKIEHISIFFKEIRFWKKKERKSNKVEFSKIHQIEKVS